MDRQRTETYVFAINVPLFAHPSPLLKEASDPSLDADPKIRLPLDVESDIVGHRSAREDNISQRVNHRKSYNGPEI